MTYPIWQAVVEYRVPPASLVLPAICGQEDDVLDALLRTIRRVCNWTTGANPNEALLPTLQDYLQAVQTATAAAPEMAALIHRTNALHANGLWPIRIRLEIIQPIRRIWPLPAGNLVPALTKLHQRKVVIDAPDPMVAGPIPPNALAGGRMRLGAWGLMCPQGVSNDAVLEELLDALRAVLDTGTIPVIEQSGGIQIACGASGYGFILVTGGVAEVNRSSEVGLIAAPDTDEELADLNALLARVSPATRMWIAAAAWRDACAGAMAAWPKAYPDAVIAQINHDIADINAALVHHLNLYDAQQWQRDGIGTRHDIPFAPTLEHVRTGIGYMVTWPAILQLRQRLPDQIILESPLRDGSEHCSHALNLLLQGLATTILEQTGRQVAQEELLTGKEPKAFTRTNAVIDQLYQGVITKLRQRDLEIPPVDPTAPDVRLPFPTT